MPVERKPLFRPDVVWPRALALPLADRLGDAQAIARRWTNLLASSHGQAGTESELLPEYLGEVFGGILGYRGPSAEGSSYSLSREKRVEVNGEFADAALGRFGPATARIVAAVEGKGPRDPLDRPFGGRALSAVDQAYRYAINLECDWIVVTNLREIRLYHKGHDQRTFERFEIATLAEQETHLRRFVFLLGAERVVPDAGSGHLAALLEESERTGVSLTHSYYADYSAIRREFLGKLAESNPDVMPEILLLHTQRLLDRVLFVAFAEDRGLLPSATLRRAFEHVDPYNPRSRWETFKGLFRAIDEGNAGLGIPGYNGGLFRKDGGLDRLVIPDGVFELVRRLGEYDYRSPMQVEDEPPGSRVVDVEILGHIFEQSITDIESLERELAAGGLQPDRVSRRKRQGAFYTPQSITRFIVERALRPVLEARFEGLRRRLHEKETKKTAARALTDPRVYDLAKVNHEQRDALSYFWKSWLEELQTVYVLDPACGSGAFLVEAFDQLHAVYQEAAGRLGELQGQRTVFEPDRTILERNLFGVDLNEEAVQIARLSIWIKTAQVGKRLTDLDSTVRAGNSLVESTEVDPRHALDWRAAFPHVFAAGGFDVVVGNPPYVRQELLSHLKPYLAKRYRSYHGVADLYVYFFERGLELLRSGGRLSFVVTNKWLKAGYAEPLRRLLSQESWVETLVDLGHAKQVFPDADVFPSIVVVAKPQADREPSAPQVSIIARESVRLDDLGRQVDEQGFAVPAQTLTGAAWALEPQSERALVDKIRAVGMPLVAFAKCKPFYGVKTGLNEAFLVDAHTRARLLEEDPRSTELLKPYLRGKDVNRWRAHWNGEWMIFSRRGVNLTEYSAIQEHLSGFKQALLPRPKDWPRDTSWPGRKAGSYEWYEIQDSVEYWELFDRPKIVYQDIAWGPQFALDEQGSYCNNTTYFLPTNDRWLLAVLNSPLIWWYAWRKAQHGKDEALRFFSPFIEAIPVAAPPDEAGAARARELTDACIALADEVTAARAALMPWLRSELQLEVLPRDILQGFGLTEEEFVAQVRRARGRERPLSSAALQALRHEYDVTIRPVKQKIRDSEKLERELGDLVNQAYGLTAEEVDLLWRTAPPRMPFAREQGGGVSDRSSD